MDIFDSVLPITSGGAILGGDGFLFQPNTQRVTKGRIMFEQTVDKVVVLDSCTSWNAGKPFTVTMTGSI